MIEYCIDVLNDVCNEVKVWSIHNIFQERKYCFEIVIKMYWFVSVLWMRRTWLYWYNWITQMKLFNWWESNEVYLTESEVWNNWSEHIKWIYPVIWDEEIMRYWDWLCAWLCGFTVSSVAGAGLRMLISICESFGSRVDYLSVWVSKNLIKIMWMINVIDTSWLLCIY